MLTVLATTLALAGATTLPATDITANSATLNGEVAGATTAHFEYGRSAGPPYAAATDDKPVTDGPVSVEVALTANTSYHFRIVSDAGVGTDMEFRTAPNPTPPRVTDQRSADVTTTAATVSGSVDPNGAATTYYFQYGRTTGYGNRTARLDAGDFASRVTARLGALRPYTRYHWRLVASNSIGVTRGADRTFRTGRLATALTLFSSRKTVPYGRGVMVGGRVSGAGVRGMTLALEQQRFPFDRGFTEVGTTHAGTDGGYLFSVDHVRRLTRYRVVSRTQDPVTSAVALVRSRPRTTIGARLLSRKRARVSGTIKPAVAGELSLQRFTAGRWKQVRHRAITGATTFSFKVHRVRKGNRAFRVVVLPVRGAYVKTKSKSVIVSRRARRH